MPLISRQTQPNPDTMKKPNPDRTFSKRNRLLIDKYIISLCVLWWSTTTTMMMMACLFQSIVLISRLALLIAGSALVKPKLVRQLSPPHQTTSRRFRNAAEKQETTSDIRLKIGNVDQQIISPNWWMFRSQSLIASLVTNEMMKNLGMVMSELFQMKWKVKSNQVSI